MARALRADPELDAARPKRGNQILAGLVGVLYNRALVGTLSVAERFQQWPVQKTCQKPLSALSSRPCALPHVMAEHGSGRLFCFGE